jgi:hypothetical protein
MCVNCRIFTTFIVKLEVSMLAIEECTYFSTTVYVLFKKCMDN